MHVQCCSVLRAGIHSLTKHTRRTVTLAKLSIVSTALVTASLIPTIALPGTAHAEIDCGSVGVALQGSSWLNGGGVNVCNHPGDGTNACAAVSGAGADSHCTSYGSSGYVWSGTKWQCVEMVNRLYLTKGWTTATWYGNGGGSDALTNSNHVPGGITVQNNGSISYINAGDVISLNNRNDDAGHAGIIDSISGTTYNIKNQNAQLSSSAYLASGSLSGGNASLNMNAWSGYSVNAIAHHTLGSTGWTGVGTAIYSGGNTMASGTTLLPNYYLASSNVQSALMFQNSDKNLVLYSGGAYTWTNSEGGQNANRLVMQTDGNLVMYRADNSVVWQSITGSNPGAYAKLQDDGNFVVYSTSGTPLWWTGTGGNPNLTYFGSDRQTAGQHQTQGQYLRSLDNRYAELLQTNGDVVLYGPGAHQLWHTNTAGAGDTFTMQTDGNLVLYALGVAKWWNGKSGSNTYAVIQTDGNFVEYNSSNFPLWYTGTGGQI